MIYTVKSQSVKTLQFRSKLANTECLDRRMGLPSSILKLSWEPAWALTGSDRAGLVLRGPPESTPPVRSRPPVFSGAATWAPLWRGWGQASVGGVRRVGIQGGQQRARASSENFVTRALFFYRRHPAPSLHVPNKVQSGTDFGVCGTSTKMRRKRGAIKPKCCDYLRLFPRTIQWR